MKDEKRITCAARVVTSAAYRGLDVVAHGKVPAFSLIYAYYTGNRLPSHWNVIVDFVLSLFKRPTFSLQPCSPCSAGHSRLQAGSSAQEPHL